LLKSKYEKLRPFFPHESLECIENKMQGQKEKPLRRGVYGNLQLVQIVIYCNF
jgi:hypothetical protein